MMLEAAFIRSQSFDAALFAFRFHLDGTSERDNTSGGGGGGGRGSRGNHSATIRSLRKKSNSTSAKLAQTEARLQEAEAQLHKAITVMADQRSEIARLRELLGLSPPGSPTHSPIIIPPARCVEACERACVRVWCA